MLGQSNKNKQSNNQLISHSYGLDFGTSNSTIGYIIGAKAKLIPVDGKSSLLPSALFAYREEIESKTVVKEKVNRDFSKALAVAIKEQRKREKEVNKNYLADFERYEIGVIDELPKKPRPLIDDAAIERQLKRVFDREESEHAELRFRQQHITDITSKSRVLVGEAGIAENIIDPDAGIYVTSPKTFLGSNLSPAYTSAFENIVTFFITHLKSLADIHYGVETESVVLGRPVNYGMGEKGENKRAIEVMVAAAKNSGFKYIDFEYEPIAAALSYERKLTHEVRTLVVDIGGGTTDATMILLSPDYIDMVDRSTHILSSKGARVGGVDIDHAFCMGEFCPYFGKESLDLSGNIINRDAPISNTIYSGLSTQTDLVKRQGYLNSLDMIQLHYDRSSGQMKERLGRLLKLRKENLHYRLHSSVETAKKLLSEKPEIALPLNYTDSNFSISLSRSQLDEALDHIVYRIRRIIDEAIQEAGVNPECIYITGGSTKSPILIDKLFSSFEKNILAYGDQLSSVGEGLIYASNLRFK
jgi:hypothetical chaperone protein